MQPLRTLAKLPEELFGEPAVVFFCDVSGRSDEFHINLNVLLLLRTSSLDGIVSIRITGRPRI